MLGLIANEYYIRNFDRWLLLLILGTFTGAYPLMYFAQEFILLNYPSCLLDHRAGGHCPPIADDDEPAHCLAGYCAIRRHDSRGHASGCDSDPASGHSVHAHRFAMFMVAMLLIPRLKREETLPADSQLHGGVADHSRRPRPKVRAGPD